MRGAVAVKGGELVIPGIAVLVDVGIHLFVINGAFVFVAATIVLNLSLPPRLRL
jgi:hypothetical protein